MMLSIVRSADLTFMFHVENFVDRTVIFPDRSLLRPYKFEVVVNTHIHASIIKKKETYR